MTTTRRAFLTGLSTALTPGVGAGCAARSSVSVPAAADLVIRGGLVYDGRGGPAVAADVAVRGDRIVAVAPAGTVRGASALDAQGLAVAPGFINVLSHAAGALLRDGRGESDVRQGVTTEIFGELSWGPLNDAMKRELAERHPGLDVAWSTVGELLGLLARKGVSTNVASCVSAGTVRRHVLGDRDQPAGPDELGRMQGLVDQAMREGALGLASELIYPPGSFATTAELVTLARVAAAHGGLYVSHMRSESVHLLEAVDELITIAREAGLPAEIYHFKAAGRRHWSLFEAAIGKVEAARAAGLAITADMYTYTASSTSLLATMPGWLLDGGFAAALARLGDATVRARISAELRTAPGGSRVVEEPETVRFAGFRTPGLRRYIGSTLAAVAAERGAAPEAVAMDLLREDGGPIQSIFFLMSEENVQRAVGLPWVSFGSDASARALGDPAKESPHPRAYGNFARLLARYVREERVLPLAEAIRRLTSFPAATFGLRARGVIAPGAFADLVVFDPTRIQDHSTYERPHQYATGVAHVLVNGVPVLRDGAHTGALPGRALRRGRGA